MTANPELDTRYGRSSGSLRRRRVIGIVAAVVFAVVLVAWVVWGGLFGENAQLESRDLGHDIVSDSLVTVQFEVTSDAEGDIACAVQALNESFTVVGFRVVHLPESETRTRQFSEAVRTSELAVSGLIYRCWLE